MHEIWMHLTIYYIIVAILTAIVSLIIGFVEYQNDKRNFDQDFSLAQYKDKTEVWIFLGLAWPLIVMAFVIWGISISITITIINLIALKNIGSIINIVLDKKNKRKKRT